MPEQPPLEKIREMKQQGMSNNQVMDRLQNAGYSTSDILNALQPPPQQPPPRQPPQAPPSQPPPPQPPPGESNEELIEAIIDEKWNDLMSDINKVISWKESTENRITRLEQKLDDTKQQFEELHKAIVGKVGEYDKHILDVGAEVKAMEKVFAKVLPAFTDNVAELSRIADDMKSNGR